MHAHERTLVASMGFADPDKRESRHDQACRYLATEEVRAKLLEMFARPKLAANQKTFNQAWAGEMDVPGEGRRHRKLRRHGLVVPDLDSIRLLDVVLEEPIIKGENQYKVVVGFLDLEFGFTLTGAEVGEQEISPAKVSDSHIEVIWRKSKLGVPSSFWDDNEYRDKNGYLVPDDYRHIRFTWEASGPDGVTEGRGTVPARYDEEKWDRAPYRRSIEYSEAKIAVEVKIYPLSVGDIIRQIKLYREFHDAWLWLVVTAFPLTASEIASLKGEGIEHAELGEGFEAFVAAEAAERAALRADRSL